MTSKASYGIALLIAVVLSIGEPVESASAETSDGKMDPTTYTGNQLYDDCTTDDAGPNIRCMFVVGDTMFGKTGVKFKKTDGSDCLPQGVTVGQVKDIVVKTLRERPESRHLLGYGIVIAVIRRNFDCVVEFPP